jgi:deoxyribonuclease-4
MIYGAHVATAGDFMGIPKRAHAMGADIVQIFAGNPRGWKQTSYTDEEAAEWRSLIKEYNLKPYIHMLYLTSYGSPDDTLRQKSIDAYAQMLQTADQLGIIGVVTHLGSHKGEGFVSRVQSLADGLVEAIETANASAYAILENSAGQGGVMGNSLEELAEIYNRAGKPDQMRFCLDTAHLMGAGIEFRDQASCDKLLDTFDQLIGLDKLEVLHINDSKVDLGEKKDRHENIGDGFVGNDGFKALLNHPRLRTTPSVLEVPGLDGRGPDKANLDRLQALTK